MVILSLKDACHKSIFGLGTPYHVQLQILLMVQYRLIHVKLNVRVALFILSFISAFCKFVANAYKMFYFVEGEMIVLKFPNFQQIH